MPLYEYRCPSCDEIFAEQVPMSESATEFTCPDCLPVTTLRRIYSFNYKPDTPGGYCPAAGKYISNERELKDEFARMSEAYTKRTGINSDFKPIHPQEVPGLTWDGLDSTFERTGKNTAEYEKIVSSSPQVTKPKPRRRPNRKTASGGWE